MKNILNSKTLVLATIAALFLTVYCKKDKDNAMTVTDVDGNVYKTVKIGNQIWMAENLRTSKYRNGDDIQLVTDPNTWKNLNTEGYQPGQPIYGFYYNWYAVMDERNLAPEGWHVATDADYTELATFLGGNAVAGGKLKETGTAHWLTPNTGATNESGFTALPAGAISKVDGKNGSGSVSFWGWTTSLYTGTTYPVVYNIIVDGTELIRANSYTLIEAGSTPEQFGCSVRCVKDK